MAENGKSRVAVFFGGRSVEHDVSILTGLQLIEAMDTDLYAPLPVYIGPDGRWWTGRALLKRSFYPLTDAKAKKQSVRQLVFSLGTGAGQAQLHTVPEGLLRRKAKPVDIDIAVSAIHGSNGEDGRLQGLFEFAGLPFAGCGTTASAVTIDKALTKEILQAAGVSVLPHIRLARPAGRALTEDEVETALGNAGESFTFPLIVKPRHLGSSIGVARTESFDDLMAAIIAAFRLDTGVIIEPFVDNLVEYNIAVRRDGDGVLLSAIERPERDKDVLDFQEKYLRGDQGGPKMDAAPSEGMASLNRVINPEDLTAEQRKIIETSARGAAKLLDLRGSVRIDFLGNAETGELWLNEINTIPGSFAFYLWQEADPPLSFTELTRHMLEEAVMRREEGMAETAAGMGGASIFGRD